jgi:NAD+ synthase
MIFLSHYRVSIIINLKSCPFMMNKSDIIAAMKVQSTIDPAAEITTRVNFIKRQLVSAGLHHLVLGISGGIDSTTCARLAQLAVDALNKEAGQGDYQFIAVRLPYQTQKDEADAQLALDFIQPSQRLAVNIKPGADGIHDEVINAFTAAGLALPDDAGQDFSKGNVKARSRMACQYDIATLVGGLVLGTDHSAENITGFYTKWGDGACDLIPLFGLSKRQVRQLASHMGAPEKLITKAPTADLECLDPQKADEQALGLSYEQIDDFLEGKSQDAAADEKLVAIYNRTQHKREPIPSIYD